MKICLCGSTRFMDQFKAVNRLLTLQGHIVYSIATASSSQLPNEDISDEQKIVLDLVHLRKIMESDAVIVIGRQENGGLYLGESTRREILWSSLWNKPTHFWTEEIEWWWNEESPVKSSEQSVRYAQMSTTQRNEEMRGDK